MKSLRVFLFALIAFPLFLLPGRAASISNRYGMVLTEESDGSYTIRDAKKIEALIGNPYRLPKALVPFEPKISVLDRASMDSVVPEDIVYKKGVTGEDLQRPRCVLHSRRCLGQRKLQGTFRFLQNPGGQIRDHRREHPVLLRRQPQGADGDHRRRLL